MKAEPDCLQIITAQAPIRVCDNGGWTDTWFAEYGKIFNIAVSPKVEVQLCVYAASETESKIVIHAENFGDRYVFEQKVSSWDRHPLLEAAIMRIGVPDDVALEATVYSEVPGGASTGTSAAVAVALIGALDRLTPGQLTPHEVAFIAQSVETDMLGQQCGIQDQLCAAYGGVNFIEMFDYPHATVSHVHLPEAVWQELERRLVLIYLGKTHSSTAVHEAVIKELEDAGPDCPQLQALRETAVPAKNAVLAGDFVALGQSMIANTQAQAALHPTLVNADARHIIEIAKAHGAVGWKVNGAGGEGGTLTLLSGAKSSVKRTMIREIEQENPFYKNIPVTLSRHGLQVW